MSEETTPQETTPQETTPQKPSRGRDYAIMAIIILVALVGIAGAGFYRDEIVGYWRFQAWNTRPLIEANQRFIEAASNGDGQTVASLCQLDSGLIEAILENNQLTGFQVMIGLSSTDVSLKRAVPTSTPDIIGPEFILKTGGYAMMELSFPGSHQLILSWDRVGGEWKVVGLGWGEAVPGG